MRIRKLVRKSKKKVRIRNYRHDIKNKEVLARIKEDGWSINRCCEKYNCSKNLILSIVSGTRPDLGDEYTRPKIRQKDLCTSCGIREKKKGNRFLCALCFDKGSSEESDIYYMGYGYGIVVAATGSILDEDEHEIPENLRQETKSMVDKREKQNNSSQTKGYNDSTQGESKPPDQ